MKIIKYVLLSILLLGSGCAAPKLTLISPTGKPIANPYYVIRSTLKPIQATYYYVGLIEVKDEDGSSQFIPKYFDRHTEIIDGHKFSKLYLVLRVFNPNNITYNVYADQILEFDDIQKNLTSNRLIAKSKLNYRQYMFNLPLETMSYVSYNIYLTDVSDKETILQTGNFSYRIKRRWSNEIETR